jgi:hypothetical protein
MRGLRAFAGAAAIAACGFSAVPAAAQAVVVRASGPSAAKFPMGTKLAAGAAVKLEAGDVVTVLDRAGTRVYKGKGAFKIDSKVARDNNLVNVLSRSLSNPTAVRAGAVRGVSLMPSAGPMVPKSVWLADIDKGGKVCVPQGSGAYLWRSTSEARRMTWLSEAEGGAQVRIAFPQGTSGVAWPNASLPLIAGRSYRIADDGASAHPVDFEIVSLAPDAIPADASELGSLLLANGCAVQFEALADTLGKLEEAEAAG